MSLLKKRIEDLEKSIQDLPWPDTTINLFVGDGRRDPPDPSPDRLQMIIKAGTPKGGCTFHRKPDETETDFIERSKNGKF